MFYYLSINFKDISNVLFFKLILSCKETASKYFNSLENVAINAKLILSYSQESFSKAIVSQQ
jgi:hypothetical protein